MKRRNKRIFLALVLLPCVLVITAVGTLIFPGWNLTPLRGYIAALVEKQVDGLEFSFKEARLQLSRGTQLQAGVRQVALGQADGERTLELGSAWLSIPLSRLVRGRIMPEEFDLHEVSVWLETDEAGIPLLPLWIQGLTESEVEKPETAAWDEFRLNEVPLIWKITEGETTKIRIREYRAHLLQKGQTATFSLPFLHIDLDGRGDGADIIWRSGDIDSQGSHYVAGKMRVNVPAETVDWENQLRLPLTPDLAAWLETGFPFLPVPSYLDTTAELRTSGRVELILSRMATSGQFALAAGEVAPAADPLFRLSLPPVTMDFESDLSFGDAIPKLHSELVIRIGEGERASVVTMKARLDGTDDSLGMETVGALKYIEDILGILPPAIRPASVTGDFRWDASLDTKLSLPAHIRRGAIAVESEGVELRFEGKPDEPLRIDPFSFSGQIDQYGNIINIAPFQFRLGPLAVDGSGFQWDGESETPGGSGTISLRPLAVADLIELVHQHIPVPEGFTSWIEEVNIDAADLSFYVETEKGSETLIDGVKLLPSWRLSIHGKPLTGGGSVRANIPPRTISIDLRAAELNPFGISIPGITEYIDVDSAMTLSLSGDIDITKMSTDLAVKFIANPGWIHFSENPILATGEAMPLHGVSTNLRLSGGLDFIHEAAAEFTLSVAPGQLNGQLSAASFALESYDEEPMLLHASVDFQPKATKDILHWIHPEAVAALPLPREILHQIDLASASLTTAIRLMHSEAGTSATLSASDASVSLRTGREFLHLSAEAYIDEDGSSRVVWSSQPWNPGQTGIEADGVLPFSTAVLQMPLSFQGAIHVPGDLPLHDTATILSDLRLHAHVSGENGYIHPNPTFDGKFSLSKVSGRLSVVPAPTSLALDAMLLVESELGNLHVETEVTDKPKTDPSVRLNARFTGGMSALDTIINVMDLKKDLPVWAQGGGFRGTIEATINARGVLRDEWTPADWPVEINLTMRDLWSPLPDESTDFGSIDKDLSSVWDGKALTTTLSGRMKGFRHGTLMSGDVGFEGAFSASSEADTALTFELDLTDFAAGIDYFATNKRAGVPGSLRMELKTPAYPILLDEPRIDLMLHARSIFFDHIRLRAAASFRNGFAGDWFGCEALDIDFFGMDYSDISLSIRHQPEGSLSFRLESQTLNLAPAVELVEPMILDLLDEASDGRLPAGDALADASDVGKEDATSATLPDMVFEAAFERIQIGNIHSFGPVRTQGEWKGQSPHTFSFDVTDGDHLISLAIDPPNSGMHQSIAFRLSELGHWLDVTVSPLRLYKSNRAVENEMLASLLKIPDYLDRGHLQFGGEFALEPSPSAKFSSVSLGDVVLQTEIAFLNRIAALVDRRVTLLIPFKEFRIGAIEFDPSEVTANDIFMEGPINLALESANYRFESGDLHILGRVFGVPFEVLGVPPDLQFFLQERSPVIRALTVEDDFEW